MNTRSLKFQLITWYAGLLAGGFILLGAVTYLTLQGFLLRALRESQLRRARQVAQLVLDEAQAGTEARVGQEIEARYAPGLNDRFVRITRDDGRVIYLSTPSQEPHFVLAPLPRKRWPGRTEVARTVSLPGSKSLMLVGHAVEVPGGMRYLVETGAPMDEVQADLRQWLIFLLASLPVLAVVAVGGGYVLVKRALSPVDRIAASAQRISSQNLSERLPVPHTGDELERLSLALNHMIERLDQAFQYSRRFVADASHELRTPLTVLRGELESSVQQPHLAPEWRERLGSALEEVERLANIVEGLFAISRLDAGEAQSEWVAFDLAQLAVSTADQMALLAEDKHIDLSCAAPQGVWVNGDRARLKQVVVNLLDNAIKFTPQGGKIVLSVRAQDGRARLEVADNGIGISPAALPRVFERFFRVDQSRSREPGGAGLGLSIVKSICTAHHGNVTASSVAGQGSRFEVDLPLIDRQVHEGLSKPVNPGTDSLRSAPSTPGQKKF